MVRLNVAIFVTRASRFFVIEPQLDLFENSVAELFEETNVCNRSPCAPERNG
jgi:hypothetical protein